MRIATPEAGNTRRQFLIATGAAAVAPGAARAQEYPSKTIRIISPFSPGATSDLVARALGPALATAWGVNVVAENKPGGGGIVGADFVAKAAPDGHTLLVAAAAIGVIPALRAHANRSTQSDGAARCLALRPANAAIGAAARCPRQCRPRA